MAGKLFTLLNGETKTKAAETAIVGTETFDAAVGAGEVAIFIDDGVTPEGTNIVQATIDSLRDFQLESEKDA